MGRCIAQRRRCQLVKHEQPSQLAAVASVPMADKLPFFLTEWEACDPEGFAARGEKTETVLETISRVRLADVQAAAAVLPLEELKAKVEAEAGPAIDFFERLTRVEGMAVLAEIKRASPSKAWIDPDCVAAEQGERYAKAGAAAISVSPAMRPACAACPSSPPPPRQRRG
jgi:hypothetical protein